VNRNPVTFGYHCAQPQTGIESQLPKASPTILYKKTAQNISSALAAAGLYKEEGSSVPQSRYASKEPSAQKSPVERLRDRRSASLKKQKEQIVHPKPCNESPISKVTEFEGGSHPSHRSPLRFQGLRRSDQPKNKPQNLALLPDLDKKSEQASQKAQGPGVSANCHKPAVSTDKNPLYSEIQNIIEKIKKDLHESRTSRCGNYSNRGHYAEGTQYNDGQQHTQENTDRSIPTLVEHQNYLVNETQRREDVTLEFSLIKNSMQLEDPLPADASIIELADVQQTSICDDNGSRIIGDLRKNGDELSFEGRNLDFQTFKPKRDRHSVQHATITGVLPPGMVIKEPKYEIAAGDLQSDSKGTQNPGRKDSKGAFDKENIFRELESLRNLTKKYTESGVKATHLAKTPSFDSDYFTLNTQPVFEAHH
jgi:hypothetical protein